MAAILKPKHSETPAAVPTIAQLADGELAINTADKKIYQRVGVNIVLVADSQDLAATITRAGNLAIAMGYAFR